MKVFVTVVHMSRDMDAFCLHDQGHEGRPGSFCMAILLGDHPIAVFILVFLEIEELLGFLCMYLLQSK